MSKIEVDQITQQSGSTLTVGGGACKTATVDATTVTLGRSGGTVSLASGASQSGFGRTGTVDWQTGSIKTSTFTAANGEGYFVNTTGGAVTANLPAGSAGAIVAFSDYTRTFATNNLTISPNGSEKIGGVAENATLDINGQALTLVYVDATEGWINVQNAEDTETGVPEAYITATGGTITTVDTNFKVHTFTGPGTFTITAGSGSIAKADYLVIAGGGGGGGDGGGGGGGGGFRESHVAGTSGPYTASPLASTTSLALTPGGYPITVGGGGPGGNGGPGAPGTDGSNSIFSTITSTGGGAGGGGGSSPKVANPGGSGGGGGRSSPFAKGTGNTPSVSPPQGNPGGDGGPNNATAAGGGAGATGGCAPPCSVGAPGAVGVATSITGSAVTRGGGGSGGSTPSGNGIVVAGAGGGGNGAGGGADNGFTGTANTGGGGGGGSATGNGNGGNAGSGVVVIRYRFQ